MNLVFTGIYKNRNGRRVMTRTEVVAQATRNDHRVQDTVDPSTDYLIASRSDTSKAQLAATMGVPVLSYQEYEERLVGPLPGGRALPPKNDPITKRAALDTPVRVPGRRALDLG